MVPAQWRGSLQVDRTLWDKPPPTPAPSHLVPFKPINSPLMLGMIALAGVGGRFGVLCVCVCFGVCVCVCARVNVYMYESVQACECVRVFCLGESFGRQAVSACSVWLDEDISWRWHVWAPLCSLSGRRLLPPLKRRPTLRRAPHTHHTHTTHTTHTPHTETVRERERKRESE